MKDGSDKQGSDSITSEGKSKKSKKASRKDKKDKHDKVARAERKAKKKTDDAPDAQISGLDSSDDRKKHKPTKEDKLKDKQRSEDKKKRSKDKKSREKTDSSAVKKKSKKEKVAVTLDGENCDSDLKKSTKSKKKKSKKKKRADSENVDKDREVPSLPGDRKQRSLGRTVSFKERFAFELVGSAEAPDALREKFLDPKSAKKKSSRRRKDSASSKSRKKAEKKKSKRSKRRDDEDDTSKQVDLTETVTLSAKEQDPLYSAAGETVNNREQNGPLHEPKEIAACSQSADGGTVLDTSDNDVRLQSNNTVDLYSNDSLPTTQLPPSILGEPTSTGQSLDEEKDAFDQSPSGRREIGAAQQSTNKSLQQVEWPASVDHDLTSNNNVPPQEPGPLSNGVSGETEAALGESSTPLHATMPDISESEHPNQGDSFGVPQGSSSTADDSMAKREPEEPAILAVTATPEVSSGNSGEHAPLTVIDSPRASSHSLEVSKIAKELTKDDQSKNSEESFHESNYDPHLECEPAGSPEPSTEHFPVFSPKDTGTSDIDTPINPVGSGADSNEVSESAKEDEHAGNTALQGCEPSSAIAATEFSENGSAEDAHDGICRTSDSLVLAKEREINPGDCDAINDHPEGCGDTVDEDDGIAQAVNLKRDAGSDETHRDILATDDANDIGAVLDGDASAIRRTIRPPQTNDTPSAISPPWQSFSSFQSVLMECTLEVHHTNQPPVPRKGDFQQYTHSNFCETRNEEGDSKFLSITATGEDGRCELRHHLLWGVSAARYSYRRSGVILCSSTLSFRPSSDDALPMSFTMFQIIHSFYELPDATSGVKSAPLFAKKALLRIVATPSELAESYDGEISLGNAADENTYTLWAHLRKQRNHKERIYEIGTVCRETFFDLDIYIVFDPDSEQYELGIDLNEDNCLMKKVDDWLAVSPTNYFQVGCHINETRQRLDTASTDVVDENSASPSPTLQVTVLFQKLELNIPSGDPIDDKYEFDNYIKEDEGNGKSEGVKQILHDMEDRDSHSKCSSQSESVEYISDSESSSKEDNDDWDEVSVSDEDDEEESSHSGIRSISSSSSGGSSSGRSSDSHDRSESYSSTYESGSGHPWNDIPAISEEDEEFDDSEWAEVPVSDNDVEEDDGNRQAAAHAVVSFSDKEDSDSSEYSLSEVTVHSSGSAFYIGVDESEEKELEKLANRTQIQFVISRRKMIAEENSLRYSKIADCSDLSVSLYAAVKSACAGTRIFVLGKELKQKMKRGEMIGYISYGKGESLRKVPFAACKKTKLQYAIDEVLPVTEDILPIAISYEQVVNVEDDEEELSD